MADVYLDHRCGAMTDGDVGIDGLLRRSLLGLRRACPGCAAAFGELEEILRRRLARDPEYAPEVWEAVRLGLVDPRRVLAGASTVAARAMRHLRPLAPEARRKRIVRNPRTFRTPAQVEALFAEAAALQRHDPRAAVDWLDLAAEVIFWLPGRGYSDGAVAALGLRAEALRANALRLTRDFRAADEAFGRLRADPRWALVAEVEVRAEVASLEASLRQDQGRFAEADALLGDALRDFRSTHDQDGIARTLIKQALGSAYRGDPAAALPLLGQAAEGIDPKEAPRRFLEVQHNLALCLCRLGRHEEAAEVVAANRELYARFPDPWTQTLRAWLEGRIAVARGDAEAAERHLLDARDRYLAHGLGCDAALVILDLAEVFVGEGRAAEVQRLAANAGVFARPEVQAEAARAMALLAKAAAAERLSGALITRLRAYLKRASGRPRTARPLPP